MTKEPQRPVVVGVGGSGSGHAAIQLAATEAAYRQAPLIAVTAYQGTGVLGGPATRPEATGLAGRKLVETARATGAQLIVLATGQGTSALAGAVSQYVLRHAPCPVLAVPDHSAP